MKNLLKNILITALLAYTAFTLLEGGHGALFVPGIIVVLGTLLTAGSLQDNHEEA